MDSSLAPLIEQIQSAASARTPLRIRGSGSKDFYGEPADPRWPVLDTRSHSGIRSYEPSELVITAKAGTPLVELEAALTERGQCLPFEPPHFAKGSTVGGMVAAGLAGPARACVGGVRDYVLGAHLINGRGEVLEFGGQVMKNVAGYDASRALAGSMGTLGLITQVSLKVLPVATSEATLRFDMDETTAIRRCNEWAGQPLPLNASSWVNDDGHTLLYLRLRGAVAAVESACARFAKEYGGVRVDLPETLADWAAARDLRLPWFQRGLDQGADLWRLSVSQTIAPLNLGDTMIEWLGGQRWLFTEPRERQEAAVRIRKALSAVSGSATLFRSSETDLASSTTRFDVQTPVLQRIQQRLKAQFDPAGIFNPGRLGVI